MALRAAEDSKEYLNRCPMSCRLTPSRDGSRPSGLCKSSL